MSEGYDIAQICLNGHVTNGSTQHMPEFSKAFCDNCGEATITICPECKNPIRGEYWGGSISLESMKAPKFCINCGKPFEWTKRKIDSAKELATLSDGFTEADIKDFQNSIENIVSNSPNIEVAKVKYLKYIKKAGVAVSNGLKDILVDIVSETVKKTIWG